MTADISVIMPTYNVAPYLERAVTSALTQRDVNVEIILVDDCSTDGTWDIISSMNDARIKRIKLPYNQGPSVARNTAIAAATAPWIALLDSDDAFLPNRLAYMLRHAKATKSDIIVDNVLMQYEADSTQALMFPTGWIPSTGIIDLSHFIRGNLSFFGGCSLGYLKPIFSADFLRRHMLAYNPAVRIGEDYLFFAEALACGARCAALPTAYYSYAVRAGSISHRLTPADLAHLSIADAALWSKYTLDDAAAKAQQLRTYKLREAYAFTLLIDGIKQRNIRQFCAALWTQPLATRHLWRAIWVRLHRLQRRVGATRRGKQQKVVGS